ncbi:C-type lectin-related protein 4 [Elysia marginata]|uniref:C-type lectin-related protein 4 n=1 Tax=Elysia marginata TaxID=1093978 RepID=A0AAV4IRV2_9GAST|nr:C-type lectin-related protein 4 [Elysia marginata]
MSSQDSNFGPYSSKAENLPLDQHTHFVRHQKSFSNFKYFPATQKNYTDALDHCSSLGAYLVSIKTSEKLELIRGLVTEAYTWIGLDDLITEGVFVWGMGEDTLTSQQTRELFFPGDTNDWDGVEDCVVYSNKTKLLFVVVCSQPSDYICEKKLPATGSFT